MFAQTTISKVSVISRKLGVEPAALLAVAQVESAGVTSWPVKEGNMPAIRFEGHYFYKKLSGAKLQKAIAAGLASPHAGVVKNPANYQRRYDLLARAAAIDPTAAYESTSWGIGQVMGDKWRKLGYSSVVELVKTAKSGVDGQIDVMARYIKAFGLVDELQTGNWLSFANQYNGPASQKNNYAAKIKQAYTQYQKITVGDAKVTEVADVSVLEAQKGLKKLGLYAGPIDGKNGRLTKAAIMRFQKENALTPDGNFGPMTSEKLHDATNAKSQVNGDVAVQAGAGSGGAGVALDAVQNATGQLQMVSDYSNVLTYIVTGLVLVGVILTMYGLYTKYKHKDAV